MGFWIGIGAAQKAARAKGINPAHRRHRIVSIVVGILLPMVIAAGFLILFLVSHR
jgi:hypothetical protein